MSEDGAAEAQPRVALVTGASRGIGRAVARELGRLGHPVACGYGSDADAAAETVAAVEAHGVKAMAVAIDIRDADAVYTAFGAVEGALGSVEVLVNNAGITRDSTMRKLTRDMWDSVIDTNLGSCFNMSKAVWEGMNERGFGRIVNIGSINGQGGQYGQVNYAAAKSGIHGFTKALAQEGAGSGITVNAIAPGYVDTEMVRAIKPEVLHSIVTSIPMGRLARPEEIAGLVAYLASDDAGYITGANISINGGLHME